MGNAIEIARSLNPSSHMVACFGADAAEQHHLWRVWLLGARGTVLWDEDGSVARPDGQPGHVPSADLARADRRLGRAVAGGPTCAGTGCDSLLAGQLPDDLAAGPAPGR